MGWDGERKKDCQNATSDRADARERRGVWIGSSRRIGGDHRLQVKRSLPGGGAGRGARTPSASHTHTHTHTHTHGYRQRQTGRHTHTHLS
eukprot:2269519-Rhodomonas_salina.2